jgi:hypothetical protein
VGIVMILDEQGAKKRKMNYSRIEIYPIDLVSRTRRIK